MYTLSVLAVLQNCFNAKAVSSICSLQTKHYNYFDILTVSTHLAYIEDDRHTAKSHFGISGCYYNLVIS